MVQSSMYILINYLPFFLANPIYFFFPPFSLFLSVVVELVGLKNQWQTVNDIMHFVANELG